MNQAVRGSTVAYTRAAPFPLITRRTTGKKPVIVTFVPITANYRMPLPLDAKSPGTAVSFLAHDRQFIIPANVAYTGGRGAR